MALSGKLWEKVAFVLGAVGALNVGLVEVFNFNLIETLVSFISLTGYLSWVYGAIGLSGAWAIVKIWK